MRILASNPDTLGDLILRQPLYAALRAAGHELALIVRPGVAPLVPHVAPGAAVIELPYEPYADDIAGRWKMFAPTFAAARAFAPDLLLIAPYRWTLFDERLADELPGVRTAAMSGRLYAGDPHAGRAPQSRLRPDVVADVPEDLREVEKNAALAAAVLGDRPAQIDPRLSVAPEAQEPARQALKRLGLEPGGYWVACVSGTAHVALKAWQAEHWGRVLAEWSGRFGRRFLFVGLHEELPAAAAVQAAMGEAAAARTAAWMKPGGTLDELLGLTALSSGYAGHDTGPMHVAAALGKPVLAVFGGGTWPRFVPAVEPSVALLVGVPCVGCGWVCSFDTSHCIKAVPPEAVIAAAADLEEGRVMTRETRVLEPSAALQAQMVREAAERVRLQIRESGERGRLLRETQRAREQEAAAAGAEAGRLRERAAGLETETGSLSAEVGRLRTAAARLEAEAAARLHEVREVAAARDAAAEESQRLGAALADRTAELADLREELSQRSIESQGLSVRLREQTAAVDRLRADVARTLDGTPAAATPGGAGSNGTGSNGDAAHGATAAPPVTPSPLHPSTPSPPPPAEPSEITALREQVGRLTARIEELRPKPKPPRVRRPPIRPRVRAALIEWIIGRRDYPVRPAPALPRVTVVLPTLNPAPDALRRTIESVVAQRPTYHDLEFIVVDGGSTDGTADLLDEYRGGIDRIMRGEDAGPMDAVAKGFNDATGDVLHFLFAGDVLEPGAVLRVAEYFSRRPGVHAVYFEDTITTADGWRYAPPPRPTADVYTLLKATDRFRDAVFFRRDSYERLGELKRAPGRAADWDLWARFDRRWELRRLKGHVRSVPPRGDDGPGAAAYREDLARAKHGFGQTFGTAGRIRCQVLHVANRLWDAVSHRTARDRLQFPLDPAGLPLPPGEPPAFAAGQPVDPITNRHPDRFLFTSPDTSGGDGRALHYVYYDSAGDAALTYPPLDLDRLDRLYAARESAAAGDPPRPVIPPDPDRASPYARYGGDRPLPRLLMRLHSPWWLFQEPQFGITAADMLLDVLSGIVPPTDTTVRLLNVGCYEGAVLETLKQKTRWQVWGTETNRRAAGVTRGKGFTVWETPPQDAATAIPIGHQFDVIFLDGQTEHQQDPLLVLRRLRQLLAPGGRIVLNGPNLDSKHVEFFGPTWVHWQVPYHRTLLGRRGLRRLAALADLRVRRLKTVTQPYRTCASVQLNQLGLGAVVPEGSKFPDDIAFKGVQLTGWSKLLWDWRGKGDYLYAVLESM